MQLVVKWHLPPLLMSMGPHQTASTGILSPVHHLHPLVVGLYCPSSSLVRDDHWLSWEQSALTGAPGTYCDSSPCVRTGSSGSPLMICAYPWNWYEQEAPYRTADWPCQPGPVLDDTEETAS